jgi:stress response protein SCP2
MFAAAKTVDCDLTNSSNLKCFKRNQRRNKKRAAKRALKKAQEVEEETVEEKSGYAAKLIEKSSSATKPAVCQHPEEISAIIATHSNSLPIPRDICTDLLSFLSISDVASFGRCSKNTKEMAENENHWKIRFSSKFPESNLSPISNQEWKRAYKLVSTEAIHKNRCFHTKKTFLETTLGLGLDFTVNPKTKRVDYISSGQDLLSEEAFRVGITTDTFGNQFKLHLPLYFSREHFERVLPAIKKTIVRLCPERKTSQFDPLMVLDVLPKIISTFVVLVADEGVAASKKSFIGLIRVHRLFLALAGAFPIIQYEAIQRLRNFIAHEEARSKSKCRSLGNLLPLLMIVDENKLNWSHIRTVYCDEYLTRSVLWVYKAHQQLERCEDKTPSEVDERLILTREAAQVGMRLNMLTVNILSYLCRGTNGFRSSIYDRFLEQMEPEDLSSFVVPSDHDASTPISRLNFSTFRTMVYAILTVKSWQHYYRLMRLKCPATKDQLAMILRNAAKNSRRKKYHKSGMNYSKIHASGSSSILTKGRKFSASQGLERVVFNDRWTFDSSTIYLDATCLLYKGKKRVATVDYSSRSAENGAILHSGDVMGVKCGTHTIELDLTMLQKDITSCVFVLSAFSSATLFDVKSASISFRDADAETTSAPLCIYNLEAHDKISHLKSVIMCKLYRSDSGVWHVLAIGDSHRGSADDYKPIYDAVQRYL